MTKKLFHDPKHWFERAEDTRRLALQTLDPVSRRMMLEIAENYESLARRAAERLQEATGGEAGWPKPVRPASGTDNQAHQPTGRTDDAGQQRLTCRTVTGVQP